MKVSYKKLWKLLIDRDMTQAQLRKAVEMSPNTMTKMRRDEEVAMSVLLKIAAYLDCNISDMCEFIKEAAIMDYDKHMLVYLNEFLFAKEHGLDFSIGAKYDIEHIMPYSGKNLSEIRKDAGIESEEEFKGIVNKLGNKILLEEKINRSIGNEWFRTKVSTKLGNKTGYIDSAYPIASALVADYKDQHKPYWKKEDINAATEKAAERIVEFIFNS